MERPPDRPSRVACMLLAGVYRYRATEDDPGQVVDVTYIEGIPTATVVDGEDAGEELDTREMVPGRLERLP